MYIYLVQKKNRAFNSLEDARNYIVTYLADFGIDINEEELRTGPDFGCVLWESKV
jgi:hypothetical protein